MAHIDLISTLSRDSNGYLVTTAARNHIVVDDAAHAAALACARGCYQEAILTGGERLSGAGLRGKARRWSASYARSRYSLLRRLDAAGVPWSEARGPHGRRTLVIGDVASVVS